MGKHPGVFDVLFMTLDLIYKRIIMKTNYTKQFLSSKTILGLLFMVLLVLFMMK